MKAPLILTPTTQSIRLVADGSDVILIVNGKAVTRMPWDKAKDVAAAMRQVAGVAEEQAKALEIAHDNAILLNTGAPFGLTDRPDIMAEAVKEALSMPGGIPSQSVVGRPRIIRHRRRSLKQ